MNVQVIDVGAYGENCIVVDDGKVAWVVDPGDEFGRIREALGGLELRRILLTHGHLDHISAIPDMVAAFPAVPTMMHPEDSAWAFTDINSFAPYTAVLQKPANIRAVADGDELADGGLRAEVIHTPGHSPGSVCYLMDGLLISGDTLFAGSCGRTDLPGGNPARMAESLERLSKLDGSIRVIPGHGPETTIARERACNPFMRT